MFDQLQREIERLSRTTSVSVPIEADAEGYYDKECPATECMFSFKIHGDDWRDIVRDEEVFCPSCRHAAPATSWWTTEHIERAKEYALDQMKNGINAAMRADAEASRRRQNPNSFIRITLEVKGGHDTLLLPLSAAKPMQLKTSCESCNCRYSYIGAAYFCPSCGKNSATHTFTQTLAAIRTAANLGPTLRQTLDADAAEIMTRTLLEKAMQDTVTSFQRLCEQLYEAKTGAPARRNAFQNLDAGSDLWEPIVGQPYAVLLGAADLPQLRIFFQQRHLLAHQQGMVDSDYVQRSGDVTYQVGQRLVIRDTGVLQFADLVERLGAALIAKV
jgi:uncharacterized Zn finger protein (UPF0148 family)